MFAAAKNLGDGAGGMADLLTRLRAREKARHGLQVAIDDDGYETPELNDRLYLHFKGYRKIQNLEPYTNLKALWLGGNGLSEIQGISHLSQLRCLYLERNLISTVKGLEGLDNLVQLDLSQNCIETTLGLRCLPALHTLNLSKNALKDADSVSPLTECSSLTNLDVTANKLAGPGVLDVLSSLKRLVSLSLSGNPILAETAHFRKTVITASPKLRYQEEKRNEDRRQMQVFRDWQAEMRQKKLTEIEARAAAGLGPPDPSPEEVRRNEERAAKAKADANEDKRLINEVGLCKIADAFYASEGKGESRRSAMETLAVSNLPTGGEGAQEPAGGIKAPGMGGGNVDDGEKKREDAKQVLAAVPAQPLPKASDALPHEEATEGRIESVGLPAEEDCASGAGSFTRVDEANEGVSSSAAAAVAGAALKETASSSGKGTAGEDANNTEPTIQKTTTAANACTEIQLTRSSRSSSSSGSGDHATSTAASSGSASTSTGGGSGGSGDSGDSGGGCGGSGDSEHEHKEGGVDEDDGSDASSEQGQEQEEKGRDHDEEKESNGKSENQSQQEAEEDEERIRRANSMVAEEEKTGFGGGEGMSVIASPSRGRSNAAAGRFQRRLEEASAEVVAELAAAPRIAVAATAGEPETKGGACLSGGRAAAGGILIGQSTKKTTWGDDLPPGAWGDQKMGWTPREDRRLERLVRECVFDFDLVAARFSSAGDVDSCGDGASRVFTAEDCRLRFAQLDRAEDSTGDESGDDQGLTGESIVYGVAAPGVLENAGLSYAELEHKARNMKSRFLEPPKELPSTKDDDNDGAEDVDLDEEETSGRDTFASTSGGHAPGGTKDDELVGGFSTGGVSSFRGIAGVGANEPDLIVVSSPAEVATSGEGKGGLRARGGSESDSDGEDDEVLTRSQIKNMVAKKAQRYEAKT
eukprot:g8459.t1